MAEKPRGPSLEDFKHLKQLGEGAFAAVYKVIRHADGETYALKKVKLPSLSDKEKQNALTEIRLLASVQHENIISYKEAFFDDRTRCLCIITEYANDGDLMNRIQRYQKERARMPEHHLWRYSIGLARALEVLHSMSIFHRDIKSANVFLSSLNSKVTIAKLGDFNVSTVAKRGLCLTQTGTPYYASPEIWRDTPYDGKSDLWALGCVMYEAAALKPPFRGEDMEGLYRSVLKGQYKKLPPIYSKDYSDLIANLLQVNPRDRPSAEDLLHMPTVKRRAAELGCNATVTSETNLLSTIKVPGRLADLSPFLPEPQYDMQVHSPVAEERRAQERPAATAAKRRSLSRVPPESAAEHEERRAPPERPAPTAAKRRSISRAPPESAAEHEERRVQERPAATAAKNRSNSRAPPESAADHEEARDAVKLPPLDGNAPGAAANRGISEPSHRRAGQHRSGSKKKASRRRRVEKDAMLYPETAVHDLTEDEHLEDSPADKASFAQPHSSLAPLVPPLKSRPAVVQSVRLPRITSCPGIA